MKNTISNRQAICELLITLARNDDTITVLCSDSRGSASLKDFADRYPQRFIEIGIAEQNIVGIAAGLAASGKKPIVASPASFLTSRSLEQIKVDVAYSGFPVILLGISGGISYGALGMTHHSAQDVATLRAIPNIDVILPADRFESVSVIQELIENPRPAYVRIGRNPVEDVFNSAKTGYRPGKSTLLHQGNDACVIACGEMVRSALDAAKLLQEKKVGLRVLDMHTIKPLDEEAIIKAAKETGLLYTMEEHSCYGGLYGAVAEVTAKYCPIPIRYFALPDEPVIAGKSQEVFTYYGITSEVLFNTIMSEMVK